MTTIITLETMKFHAFHGVPEEERITGNTFTADITYAIETQATETDKMKDTVSYAEIYGLVKEEMAKPSRLIEHVAGRIIKAVRNRFPQIEETTLKISKLNPPVGGEVGKASVSVTL